MNELISKEQLLKLDISESTIIEKFLFQLHKDFEMCELNGYLVNIHTINYDLLKSSIANALEIIERKEKFKFQSLLYKIDVPEKQLQLALKNYAENYHYLVIAEFIIKRILQKVILKITFSK